MSAAKDPERDSDDVSRAYAEIVEGGAWHLDVPTESIAEPVPEPPPVADIVEAPPAPRPQPEAAPPPPSPHRILEAMLFVGGEALTAERATEIIRGLTAEQVRTLIDNLNRQYRHQHRPYAIRLTPQGYVLQVKPSYQAVRERLFGGPREVRLSQPALDVLSLVAYRQPATKLEVDSLRGADSGALLRQLVRLGLVAVTRRGEEEAREVAYGTTPRFLEVFRLVSLDDLPRTGDPQRV